MKTIITLFILFIIVSCNPTKRLPAQNVILLKGQEKVISTEYDNKYYYLVIDNNNEYYRIKVVEELYCFYKCTLKN